MAKNLPSSVSLDGDTVKINPNLIRTRVPLDNKTVTHINKKKEQSRRKCRQKVRW